MYLYVACNFLAQWHQLECFKCGAEDTPSALCPFWLPCGCPLAETVPVTN